MACCLTHVFYILRRALVAAAISCAGVVVEASETVSPLADLGAARPGLNLALRASSSTAVLAGQRWGVSPLQAAVVRSSKPGWYQEAIQASIDAVVDCQKGDHPGGGMGVFSIATLRPASPSDHCRRF
jgi:hypothetical protein